MDILKSRRGITFFVTYLFYWLLVFFVLYTIIQSVIEFPEWSVTGNISDTLGMIAADNSIVAFLLTPYLYVPPFVCYMLLGLILICKKGMFIDYKL